MSGLLSHQQNSKIFSGFRWFCWFFWFPETWKGNFQEKSQHRSGLGWAGLNDARPCHQVSMKRDIGSQVLMFPSFLWFLMVFSRFLGWETCGKLNCPNTDGSVLSSSDQNFKPLSDLYKIISVRIADQCWMVLIRLSNHWHVRQGWIWRPKHVPLYSSVFVKYWKEYKHWLDLSQKSKCGQ